MMLESLYMYYIDAWALLDRSNPVEVSALLLFPLTQGSQKSFIQELSLRLSLKYIGFLTMVYIGSIPEAFWKLWARNRIL